MSTPTPAKRRRLNHAASTLSKPFRSPLKTTTTTAPSTPARTTTNADTQSRPYNPSTLAHTISSSACPSPAKPAHPSAVPKTPLPTRTPLRQSHTSSSIRPRADPSILAAQKYVSALETRIRSVRAEIELLQRAAAPRCSSTDSELAGLTAKWRTAAQAAAEELFGGVKDRVNKMGGVGAWREAERRKREGRWDDSGPGGGEEEEVQVEEFDSQGEELPEEEVEARREDMRRARKEMRDAMEEVGGGQEEQAEKGGWEEVGQDDDEFTMDMMLRSMHIDLETIGFDRELQRWVE